MVRKLQPIWTQHEKQSYYATYASKCSCLQGIIIVKWFNKLIQHYNHTILLTSCTQLDTLTSQRKYECKVMFIWYCEWVLSVFGQAQGNKLKLITTELWLCSEPPPTNYCLAHLIFLVTTQLQTIALYLL